MGGAQGQASDIAISAEHILKIKKKINAILSEKTGQSIERITMDSERDFYMDAEQAIDYGIIDKIFVSRKQIKEER
jgi:ATP-dependent Clp protease protease subunit